MLVLNKQHMDLVPVSSDPAAIVMAEPIIINAYTLLTSGNTTIARAQARDEHPSTKYPLYLSYIHPPAILPTKYPTALAVNTYDI